MKFCFFGYDHTLDIALRLVADGHELLHIFTFPCDNQFVYNTQIYNYAAQTKIPITEEAIKDKLIKKLIKKGCKFFISSGYPYKIPEVPEDKAYAFNLHPALLPRARGIMPVPFIIMNEPEAAGFTLHKMTEEYDAGDILLQKPIKIDENTDIETLSAKIALAVPSAISEIVENIEKYWKEAKPQNHKNATEYAQPSKEFRTLNWTDSTETLNKKMRAFGRFGIIATISNDIGDTQKLAVYNATAWQDKHIYDAGTLLRTQPKEIVIATSDGYICLKEFQIIG